MYKCFFFFLGLSLLVGVTQQHPLSVPEHELELMHVLCNADSQFNFKQHSRRKKLCFKDNLWNVRPLSNTLGLFNLSVSAQWHDLWTLEWHSLPRTALYSACPSLCLSTLIWPFCWDWTWRDGWSNDSSGQDIAALTSLPPPPPSLWTPRFWGVLGWYLGVWTFLTLVLWRG